MKDNILDKYAAIHKATSSAGVAAEGDGLDDFGAFGFLRGIRDRAIMLEVRCKDGTAHGFGYAWLSSVRFDPSEGITLQFGADMVKITGRNLNGGSQANVSLFGAILRHRVPWIQEADEPSVIEAGRDQVVIECVTVE